MSSRGVVYANPAECCQSKTAWDESDQRDSGRLPSLPLSGIQSLRDVTARVQSSGGIGQNTMGLAKMMGLEAWSVMSIPLDSCASHFQRVAVLTDKSLLQAFECSKLNVLGSATVVFPGHHRAPAIVAVLRLPWADVDCPGCKHKSAAAQITDLIEEVKFVNEHSLQARCRVEGWRRMWPLQDASFNLAMSVQASGSFTQSWSDFAMQFFKWREDVVWIRAVARHFGYPVACLFSWVASYIRCLWVLAFFGFIFALLEGSLSEGEYDTIRPFFCLVVILFVVGVSEFEDPEKRIIEVSRASGLEPEEDQGANLGDTPSEDRARAQYIIGRPAWVRGLRTCLLLPCAALQFCIITLVFVSVFWLEVYIIFEWGQCRRINEEHRAEHGEHSGFPCRSSDMYRGYWPSFVESLPSITEGILFELLVGISKSMATLVCDQQNWRTEQQYQFAFVLQVFLIEMIGKVGFVSVLAFSFTPIWGLYSDCETAPDSLVFGRNSISCIKEGVPYQLRKKMLQRAMRGPMLVSMLVGMTVKVLVPRLIVKMVWASRMRPSEERRRSCGFCTSCGRWLLRLLGLIFIFDCDAVGGLSFLKNKMLHLAEACEESHEKEVTKWSLGHRVVDLDNAGEHSDALSRNEASPFSGCASQDNLPRSEIEGALHEGLRKEFTVADEYLEVMLHFTYFSFFGLVWPLGCLFALVNFLLEYRFDVAKLGHVRRRPMPKQDKNLRKLLKAFAMIVSTVALPFNVLMMLIPFEVLVIWFPEHFTEEVTEEGSERTYTESLALADYVPYWVLAFFLTSLVLFTCSYLLRLGIREVRRRDLQTTLKSLRESNAQGLVRDLTVGLGNAQIYLNGRMDIEPITEESPGDLRSTAACSERSSTSSGGREPLRAGI